MKRIRRRNAIAELFGRLARNRHLLGRPDRLGVRLRNFVDVGFTRQRLEDPSAQNVIEFV